MTRVRWAGQILVMGMAVARTAAANTVMSPWARQAEGWLGVITSIWVPIIFTLITVALLVTVRVMGDNEEWISKLLNVLVKASMAANAFAIVGFFVGTATNAPAATLDEVLTGLEGWLP